MTLVLILMVDQERFPTTYETTELQDLRKQNLSTRQFLQDNGFSFLHHYAGSTACCPSRTTLYTGQYPSLHGVTQTNGVAKHTYDADVFWLDPNSVPTIGDYFRTAGYHTFWKGRWHASATDIRIPGTTSGLSSYDRLGYPDPEEESFYYYSDRLENYGFSGWIGPEPHGSSPRNSGSSAAIGLRGRDEIHATQTVNLLMQLDQHSDTHPWLFMCSFVNPHDIALYGQLSARIPLYDFQIDPTLPRIPPPPTAVEDLYTKPSAQASYRSVYQEALQPTRDTEHLRKLYFSLQKQVDHEMGTAHFFLSGYICHLYNGSW
ncbi:sulfatase-like hydrolase/transferase [Polycladospora coralii]|uniref:sulfatase-like hydrolase/transferase n=1 Tax=Polycladospora coralii TaxID=2771432 RepID=UPI0034E2C3B6